MSFKYGAYIKHFYYLKKGEANVKNEFKAGDLVFEILINGEMLLTKLSSRGDYVCTRHASYNHYGINEQIPICQLLHATPENRQALATLYGEDAVPELPLRGSELTRKLLERQKYVLCVVSYIGDDNARSSNPPKVRTVTAVEDDGFTLANGGFEHYAVPIDNNGNEITEIDK